MSVAQEFEFVIQWHLTERCNLRCSHCYQDGSLPNELATSEIRAGLDEIGELFSSWSGSHGLQLVPSFNITGGEPLLRSDLFEVLGDIAARGWKTYVLTNGTRIGAEEARRIAGLGIAGVQISIEGPEAVHDSLRGRGTFQASLAGIRALIDAGVPVTINTTLSEINADGFFELAESAAQLGVQRLGYSRLVPSGRGGRLAGRMLPADRVRTLYQRIRSLSYEGMTLVTGDPVAAQMRSGEDGSDDQGDVAVGGCSAGVSGLTFLADGTIVPCRRLPIPLGNIRADSVREVWATSPVLDALRTRSRYEGACGVCRRWATCRGCRAIAFAASRNAGSASALADDPQCFLA
jgi:MoaA/NifB/PqqE/SkfB family radical SAM enzyme